MADKSSDSKPDGSVLPAVLGLLAVAAWVRYGILSLLAAVPALIGWAWLRHMKGKHGPGPLIWRWMSGQPLDGKYRTNATWLRWSHGDKPVLHPTGHAVPWHHMPRLYRAAIRGGGTAAVLLAGPSLAVEFIRHRRGMTETGIAACAVLLVAVAWLVYGKVRNWRHVRDYVNPLNLALPPDVTVRELPRDRSRAVLALPHGFTGDKDKQLVMQAAAAKLNHAVELHPEWRLHGKRPEVVITLVQPPPGYVSFADIRALADDAAEHEAVLGLGRKGVPGIVSVDNDSPHVGLSMGSGDGKSVTARNVACQLAHHGALIVVLDTKLTSQHWAAGLPNVAYARTPAEIHALAVWLAGEIDRRNNLVLLYADVEGKAHVNPGPRIVGILEEMNATQAALTAHWKEDLGGKGRSPAVAALDKVSFTGRAVGVNLFYIGQRLSAKATSGGSGDARENLGVLLMSNPGPSTWKMLVGDRHALPSATDAVGRLQVVTAKAVTEVQGAYVTGAQAREYATSGVVAVPRDDMPCVGGLAPVGTAERAAQNVPDIHAIEGNGPDLHVVPDTLGPSPLPPRITIPEAVAEGVSGPTYDAVRKALARDLAQGKPVPVPVGRRGNADEYDRTEWCDWEETRRQPRRLAR